MLSLSLILKLSFLHQEPEYDEHLLALARQQE